MILASKEISRRNNLPVYLRGELWEKGESVTRWCVECTGRALYADTFEDAVEYIKKRKLMSAKKLECIDDIKQDLLQEVERKLKQLQRLEDIRNTPEYRGAKTIREIRQQLKFDGVANSERDASKLIELHYLNEIEKNIFSILQELQDK